MRATATTKTTYCELAQRVSGGLEITLFRDTRNNTTNIELRHEAIKEPISFRIQPEHALDAFNHPFVYLERRLPAFRQ